MADRTLLANLSKLGISMFEPDETPDVNKILADVVKSRDTRLWEGFPVMLANAGKHYVFDPEQVGNHLKDQKQKDLFFHLMLFSGAMFSFYHLSFPWWQRLKGKLTTEHKALMKAWKSDLVQNRPVVWHDAEIDAERAKRLFELYFEQEAKKDRRRREKFEGISLEYALSQVFSAKQKELFKKKLEGLPLTKTEQEYYSRAVKKKVLALANADLHSLSKKVLGV